MKSWIKFLLPLTIVLAAVVVGQKVIENKQRQPEKSGYGQTVGAVSEPAIDEVNVLDQKGALVFKKNNGVWELDGKKADQEKLNGYVAAVLNKSGANYELISQNPARFTDLGITEASPKIILKSGGKEAVSVILGASHYPGTYVKPLKEDRVYLTTQSLSVIPTADSRSYLEKPADSSTTKK